VSERQELPVRDLVADTDTVRDFVADTDTVRDFVADTETAHRHAIRAATEGLRDAALGPLRLTGPGVPVLAEAAVSSATPFLRAPLLARIADALRLHVAADGACAECRRAYPCPTAASLVLTPPG
jgi:hypothetical protein